MSGGNHRGRGSRGAPRGETSPGRGRGGYRGRVRGRGGGRGGYHTLEDMEQMYMIPELLNRGTASPRGRGGIRGKYSQQDSGRNTPSRGRDLPRGRGRGDFNDRHMPLRGSGRGRGGPKLRSDAPLSGLLYQERPFLRPVLFVPSVYTKTLFQEEEEILKPVIEEVGQGEESHVPTADRVSRVFSGGVPPMPSSASEDDEIEEIDFNDIAKLLETPDRPKAVNNEVSMVEQKFTGFYIDTNPTLPTPSSLSDVVMGAEEAPTAAQSSSITPDVDCEDVNALSAHPYGVSDVDMDVFSAERIATNLELALEPIDVDVIESSTPITDISVQNSMITNFVESGTLEEPAGFYIDIEPTRIDSPHPTPPTNATVDEDEEVIVYVAPHPRSGRMTPVSSGNFHDTHHSTSILTGTSLPRNVPSPPPTTPKAPIASGSKQTLLPPSTPIPPAPSFESVSFSFSDSPAPKKQSRQIPIFTARSRTKAQVKLRRQEARAARKRMERQAMFGSFGAIMSEAQLRGENPKRDPNWNERRRDDSDIDWGEDENGADIDGGVNNGLAEGMELDPDLEIDPAAMRSFAESMSRDGGQFVTMEDIADKERMKQEDEESRDVGSSGVQ